VAGAIGSPAANAGAMGSSAVGAKITQTYSAGAIGSPAANAGAMGSSAVGCDWHRLVCSIESSEQGIITSDSVLSKTAIFPKNEGRKREISNESARGSSRRKAIV